MPCSLGAPEYFERHPVPTEPRELVDHRCLNLRLPTSDTLNPWRLLENGSEIRIRSDGPMIFNSIELILDAALDGTGLAYLPFDQVEPYLESGRLTRIFAKQTSPLPPYHLYYPNRRHSAPAFRLFVDALRRQVRRLSITS